MADRYNSRIARLLGWCNGYRKYAITISEYTTLYSCPASQVDPAWRRHEDQHKRQYMAYGSRIRYWWTYTVLTLRYGYYRNPLELAAREAERCP